MTKTLTRYVAQTYIDSKENPDKIGIFGASMYYANWELETQILQESDLLPQPTGKDGFYPINTLAYFNEKGEDKFNRLIQLMCFNLLKLIKNEEFARFRVFKQEFKLSDEDSLKAVYKDDYQYLFDKDFELELLSEVEVNLLEVWNGLSSTYADKSNFIKINELWDYLLNSDEEEDDY